MMRGKSKISRKQVVDQQQNNQLTEEVSIKNNVIFGYLFF
jgi:hypothetical protein